MTESRKSPVRFWRVKNAPDPLPRGDACRRALQRHGEVHVGRCDCLRLSARLFYLHAFEALPVRREGLSPLISTIQG
jgi:hypothetical protein